MKGRTLYQLFGGPGFLSRVPAGTCFDLKNGVLEIPCHDYTPDRFVRSEHSRLWYSVDSDIEPRALGAH